MWWRSQECFWVCAILREGAACTDLLSGACLDRLYPGSGLLRRKSWSLGNVQGGSVHPELLGLLLLERCLVISKYLLIDWFQHVLSHNAIASHQPCSHHLVQIYTFNLHPFITPRHATGRLVSPTFLGTLCPFLSMSLLRQLLLSAPSLLPAIKQNSWYHRYCSSIILSLLSPISDLHTWKSW